MQERVFRSVALKKDLVLDVCEPYAEKVKVKFSDGYFNMFKFGTLEYNDELYAYGAEESEYIQHFGKPSKSGSRKTSSSSKRNKKTEATDIPIVFAKIKTTKKSIKYELAPANNFLCHYREVEAIEETINFSLESQRNSMRYSTRCCG